MNLAWHSTGAVSVLAINGRFDSFEAARISEWLEHAAEHEPARIVVDLAGVTFIDSTGLATLVKGLRRCRQQSGDLVLCGLQQAVHTIFQLTRLDQAFGIFPSEAAAVASADG